FHRRDTAPPRTGSVADPAFHRAFEILEFLAAGPAADQADRLQIVGRLEQVALLDMPHAVVLPGANVLGIDGERLFVPDAGKLVVAELAVGIADIVGDLGALRPIERLERRDALFILSVEDERPGGMVAVDEFLLRLPVALLFL